MTTKEENQRPSKKRWKTMEEEQQCEWCGCDHHIDDCEWVKKVIRHPDGEIWQVEVTRPLAFIKACPSQDMLRKLRRKRHAKD